jgi:hypothetical protein
MAIYDVITLVELMKRTSVSMFNQIKQLRCNGSNSLRCTETDRGGRVNPTVPFTETAGASSYTRLKWR